MDQTGLVSSIVEAVEAIAKGRKGYATKGYEQESRAHYEKGISIAVASFKTAAKLADPKMIALLEQTFLQQELVFCPDGDKNAQDSLNAAIQSFDNAFLCLEVVDEPGYIAVEKSHPRSKKYRVQDYPKDAFHIACISHHTQLRNSLRTPGIDMIEKAALEQRAANLNIAQRSYLVKQKAILTEL